MYKFLIIKTKEQGIFISDNLEDKPYFSSSIPNLFFDGIKLLSTFKSGWYKLDKMPTKVEKQNPKINVNKRYELKEGFPVTELTPSVITDLDDIEEGIKSLYNFAFDTIEGEIEEVDFDIEVLSEEDNFYIETPKYKSTPDFITSLTVHSALHTERPCYITGKDLYKVVRNYIKYNINPKYATITSDYDFCLSVQKVISHSPESYQVDIGKRKPKYETRYRRNRTVMVFETSPEGYGKYPKLEGISAKNQRELDDKINDYLDEVLKKINEPLIECECCKGLGVIIDKV